MTLAKQLHQHDAGAASGGDYRHRNGLSDSGTAVAHANQRGAGECGQWRDGFAVEWEAGYDADAGARWRWSPASSCRQLPETSDHMAADRCMSASLRATWNTYDRKRVVELHRPAIDDALSSPVLR